MSLSAIATRSTIRRNSSSHSSATSRSPLCSTVKRHKSLLSNQYHPQYVISPHRGLCPSYTNTVLDEISSKRFRSTIFFSDEKGSAEENVYFKKEDESLLKNLLSNHPEFNPKYSTALLEEEVGTLARDLRLVCKKHGVSNMSLPFIRDVQTVFEMHGWKKSSTSPSRPSEGGETVSTGRPSSFLRSSKTSPSLRP